MVAIVEPCRPTRRAHARQCMGSDSCARDKNPDPGTDRNGQYSITALTDGGGSIVERYAYTADGQVTFADAGRTVQTGSASNNRYTYTGREWDAGLSLYHYRARMYDALAGTFVSRDPIGFEGSPWGLYEFLDSRSLSLTDPFGKDWRNSFGWLFGCKKVKNLYDCTEMRPRWNEFEAECQQEKGRSWTQFLLQGIKDCPEQIYPIVNKNSARHADLCCIFKKANSAGPDMQNFGDFATNCINGMTLPLSVAGILLPRAH